MRMPKNKKLWGAVGASAAILAAAAWFSVWIALAIVVAAAVAGFIAKRYQIVLRRGPGSAANPGSLLQTVTHAIAPRIAADPTDTQGLVEEMLAQGRYALLLRKQVVSNLTDEQFERAREALSESMALVPEGEVVLGPIDQALDDGRLDNDELALHEGKLVRVAALFLDRYPVTNLQFQEFVDGGGYGQMSIWDPHIWPAVLDFVDLIGLPRSAVLEERALPARPGTSPRGRHQLVRGRRLCPLGWKTVADRRGMGQGGQLAGAASPTLRMQRKYPWGDSMDRGRCNLWGSGPGRVVAVTEYLARR